MRRSWVLAALLAGCALDTTSDPPDPSDPNQVDRQNGACTVLEYHSFQSKDELDCSPAPDFPLKCRWDFVLTKRDSQHSEYHWHHSDSSETGSVRCAGRRLTADGPVTTYTGVYDPNIQQLIWQGVPYLLQ